MPRKTILKLGVLIVLLTAPSTAKADEFTDHYLKLKTIVYDNFPRILESAGPTLRIFHALQVCGDTGLADAFYAASTTNEKNEANVKLLQQIMTENNLPLTDDEAFTAITADALDHHFTGYSVSMGVILSATDEDFQAWHCNAVRQAANMLLSGEDQ